MREDYHKKVTFTPLPDEKWVDFPECDAYMVSNYGRVRNGNRLLVQRTNAGGYKKVSFQIKGKKTFFLVHRLVGICFIPNPENKRCINHLDAIRANNHYSNLEWCTHSENTIHAVNLGHQNTWNNIGRSGANHPCSKKVNQYDLNGNFIATHGSVGEAARVIGCHKATIMDAVSKRRPMAFNYKWEYADPSNTAITGHTF